MRDKLAHKDRKINWDADRAVFSTFFRTKIHGKCFPHIKIFHNNTGRFFSVGSLTNTRSEVISIFATITNIVKVSALLMKMFFHLVKIQYGGASGSSRSTRVNRLAEGRMLLSKVNRMRGIHAELVTRPRADHKSLWMKEREKVKLGKYHQHQQLLFRSRWDHLNSSEEFRESTVTTRRRNASIESTHREFFTTKARRQISA